MTIIYSFTIFLKNKIEKIKSWDIQVHLENKFQVLFTSHWLLIETVH